MILAQCSLYCLKQDLEKPVSFLLDILKEKIEKILEKKNNERHIKYIL